MGKQGSWSIGAPYSWCRLGHGAAMTFFINCFGTPSDNKHLTHFLRVECSSMRGLSSQGFQIELPLFRATRSLNSAQYDAMLFSLIPLGAVPSTQKLTDSNLLSLRRTERVFWIQRYDISRELRFNCRATSTSASSSSSGQVSGRCRRIVSTASSSTSQHTGSKSDIIRGD